MKNKKLASHRRPIVVDKTKSVKGKIENDDLENSKCKNLSLNTLLMVLQNINPVFFTFDKKKNHVLRATINYENSSDIFFQHYFIKSKHYFIKVKDNKITLSSDKEFLFENKDCSSFTLKDLAFYIIEKIKDNFYLQMQDSGYLFEKTAEINYLLRDFCKNNNIDFEDIEYKNVSLEEIYNKEIKVNFNINNVLIEEYLDLYIEENRLDMLEDVLKNKYSVKEADEIKSLLQENVLKKEMKNKKRM